MIPVRQKHMWLKDKFFGLLLILISILVILPFFPNNPIVTAVLRLFLTGVLILSVYAIAENKRSLIIASVLCSPAFIMNWLSHFLNDAVTMFLSNLFPMLFFMYMIYEILVKIFTSKYVTVHLIYGSICVYFLIGLSWGFLYNMIEIANPGSFSGSHPYIMGDINSVNNSKNLSNFIYYSFITLTTLGYGDITPQTPPAQNLSSFEAIVGQLYLTILVARLVGVQISQQNQKE